jgi:hypothetical protein
MDFYELKPNNRSNIFSFEFLQLYNFNNFII